MRLVKAAESGKCVVCGGHLAAGSKVLWAPGRVKHAEPAACGKALKAAGRGAGLPGYLKELVAAAA